MPALEGSESVRRSRGRRTRVDTRWESVPAKRPANDTDSVNVHGRQREMNFGIQLI